MIITSNGRSQQTPPAKGGKVKIQRLDQVSCPDTEIQVLPNLGIAVDRVSCPDMDIEVSGTICITCPILHEIVCINLKATDMY
jgi:hypothetical protein